MYLWEYTLKLLHLPPKSCHNFFFVVQGRVQLEHRSHMLRSVLRLHANTSSPGLYDQIGGNGRKEMTKPVGPFGSMPQELWHPEKGAKLDCVIKHSCGEECTHANYKTTRTWENFNNQRTKVILLSEKLWLIANNSKNFASGTGASQQ